MTTKTSQNTNQHNKHPHGAWIWHLSELRDDYLDKFVECNVKRVYLKVFDGKSRPMFWSGQCSPEIIQEFKSYNIQVYGWGYHYGTPDIDAQVSAVKDALDCGLDGYVVDVESEVEDKSTHPHVDKLLSTLRSVTQKGTLGYTSFGHPGFHPDVPWEILNKYCDIALPQIYFERFNFRSSNEAEVKDCLQAHEQLGIEKPILPIWSSEPNVANPVSAKELQFYLKRFPGSSIWRLPEKGESGGEGWNLNYDPVEKEGTLPELPTLKRYLERGVKGDDVLALQKMLNGLRFNAGPEDRIYGRITEFTVISYQTKADITVDGVVGSETWRELGGDACISCPPEKPLGKLADLAEEEAAKNLRWTGPDCEAEKYLKPLRDPMRERDQHPSEPIFYDWCAAFVTWCCREVGIEIPDAPEGFWATMALVQSWKHWAKQKGYWHPKGSITPQRGDILVVDWSGTDPQLEQIGIVRGYTSGSSNIRTAEGNKGNKTANIKRSMSNVAGLIRITDFSS
jgi:hypothetical protein